MNAAAGMGVELWGLVALALLVLVQVGAQSMSLKADVGDEWTVGPRDGPPPFPPGPRTERLRRALANLLETAPVYVCLAVAAVLGGRAGPLTEAGALVYLVGRIAYLPAALSDRPHRRTAAWLVASSGLAIMLVGVFVGGGD